MEPQSFAYWVYATYLFFATHTVFSWVCVSAIVLFFVFRIWYKEQQEYNTPKRNVKPHNQMWSVKQDYSKERLYENWYLDDEMNCK